MSDDTTQLKTKPWEDFRTLVSRLKSRGMIITDEPRAARKLSQVGYYRLSGFWYSCREYEESLLDGKKILDSFQVGTTFKDVFELYLFDKKLRSLMMEAIERIEIYVRTQIAHVVAKDNVTGYLDKSFIKPKSLRDYTVKGTSKKRNDWEEWQDKSRIKLSNRKETFIKWHLENGKPIPMWAAIEAWDFGMMSKYYSMLDRTYQQRIARNFGLNNPSVLGNWLIEINTLRNRCAHHSRIWNQTTNDLKSGNIFLLINAFKNETVKTKLMGIIYIIWHMVKIIGPGSQWILRVEEHVNNMPRLPSCSLINMGCPNGVFPFDIIMKSCKYTIAKTGSFKFCPKKYCH